MVCRYCRANNDEHDHRCNRCGRRLGNAETGPVSMPYPHTRSSLAPELHTEPAPATAARVERVLEVVPRPAEPRVTDHARPGVQASLFPVQEVQRAAAATRSRSNAVPRVRREAPRYEQPRLDFEIAEGTRTLPTSVRAAIYCNAPVALASYRVMAAITDTTIGIAGTLVAAVPFFVAGHGLDLSKPATLVSLGLATFLICVLYKVLFCFGNADTLGMRSTRLRLVTFRGHRPTRRDRFIRLAGGLVTVASLGVGALWALLDEERIAWHDKMSSTFPTMVE